MTEEQMKAVLREHGGAEMCCDLEGTMRTMPDDCFQEQVAIGLRCDGQTACARYYVEAFFTPFPDLGSERLTMAIGRDTVITESRVFGTMTGAWLGIAPTGRPFSVPITAVIRFRDGKLLGETLYYDSSTWCEQVGIDRDALVAAAARLTADVKAG